MLVFGPYRAIPNEECFVVYNLSSLTEFIPRLPGLYVIPNFPSNCNSEDDKNAFEANFDNWYYNYIIENEVACSSLMSILFSLYQGNNVYVCISDLNSNDLSNILNESFMKFIQIRYDIKYSVINNKEDFDYIPKDGCDFMSIKGIMTFDKDKKEFMQILEEQKIINDSGV